MQEEASKVQWREVESVPAPEALGDADKKSASSSRRRRRKDWRLGGRSVRKWDHRVLAVALFGGGAGVLGASGIALVREPWASLASTVALWIGLAAAVVYALTRSRPIGLLSFRPQDIIWGLGLGLGMRVVQGWVSGANSNVFPGKTTSGSSQQAIMSPSEAFATAAVAPVIEELFFRAVILVTIYQLLRRATGGMAAGVTAALVSAGSFLLLHAAFAPLDLADSIQFVLLGLSSAGLVLLTGRVWGAVVLHIVYNVSYVAIVMAGTLLS